MTGGQLSVVKRGARGQGSEMELEVQLLSERLVSVLHIAWKHVVSAESIRLNIKENLVYEYIFLSKNGFMYLSIENSSSRVLNSKWLCGTEGLGPSGMRSRHMPDLSPAVGGSRKRPRAWYLQPVRGRV